MPECRCVSGVIVEEGTTTPQAGLTVKVGTVHRRGFLPIGEGHTNALGRFSIDIGVEESSGETGTMYAIKVFAGAAELETEGNVSWSEGMDACDLVICVTYPTACAAPITQAPGQLNLTGVFGEVRHVDGTAIPNLVVEVRVVGLAGETVISTGTTGASGPLLGWYGLAGPGAAADVLVKVFEAGSPNRYVGSSVVHYQAAMPLRVDIKVCDDALRGPSEFARIDGDLSPLLGATNPNTVGIDGTAWMAGRSNWPLDRVLDWLLAKRLNITLPAPTEPIYGLLREGFPKTKDAILARAPSQVRRALRIAKRDNIIANAVPIEAFVTALAAARAAALDDGDPDDIGVILRTSQLLGQAQALTNVQITAFCALYAEHTGTDAEFWEALAALGSFNQAAINEARRLLVLATIGLNHAPCVTAMLHELGTGSASLTGGWSVATWQKIAGDENPPSWANYVNPLPYGLEGDTVAERRAALAVILREHAQSTFAVATVNSGLGAGTYSNLSAVQGFFSNPANANVDLATARIYAGNTALTFSNPTVEVPAIQTVQRLYRIAPAMDALTVMDNLAGAGYTSARDVAKTGKARFIAEYTAMDADGAEIAREVYSKAASQTAMSASFFLSAHPSLGRLPLAFVPDDPTLTSSLGDEEVTGWSELFGNVGGCQCKWCRSIHGPAAYLVDLLHWLSSKTAPSGVATPATALDALKTLYLDATTKTRRLDLTQIPLTCENTERVLPYIDLTMEILESIVAGTWNPSDIEVRSSEQETPELLASPQYTNPDAYSATTLGGSTVSPRTPFHQPLTEMRAFLAHLGLDRAELMRDFGATLGGTAPTTRHIAMEELGLSVEAAEVIETANTVAAVEANYWPLSVTDAPTVRSFRRAAEVTYPDILDMLHTRTVNPNRAAMIEIVTSGTDPYDVGSYYVGRSGGSPATTPTVGEFSTMRQFLRLWRATGWTMLELDKALIGLDVAQPTLWDTTAPIRAVGDLLRLSRMTEVPPVDLVAWFSDIDTWEDRETKDSPVLSLWDRTWLNTSVFPEAEIEETTFPFRLNGARTQVVDTNLELLSYTDKLHAVLGVDEEEVEALIELLNADAQLELNTSSVPAVTRTNLSRLYRWTSLARVLKLDPTDVYAMFEITGINPFANPDRAIDFIEEVGELLSAGFSSDELDYLLRHGEADRVGPTEEFLGALLGGVRDSIKNACGSSGGGATLATLLDDVGRRVSEALGVDRTVLDELRIRTWPAAVPSPSGTVELPSDEDVAPTASAGATAATGAKFVLLAAADWTPDGGSATTLPIGTVFTLAATSASLTLTTSSRLVIPMGEQVSLTGTAYTFAASATATLRGDGTTNLSFPGSVAVVLTDGSTGTFNATTSAALSEDTTVTLSAATTTALPEAIAGSDILKGLLRMSFWDVTVSTSSGDPWEDILTDTEYADDLLVVEALFKATLLLKKLGADEDERLAWYARISGWNLIDPASFAAVNIMTTYAMAYDHLKNTVDLFALRQRLPGDTPTFAEIIADPSVANFTARTGWDEDSVDQVLTWMGTPDVDGLVLALDRLDAIRRAGTAAMVVAGWAGRGNLGQINSTRSRETVAAARSRYATPEAWAVVARPIRDRVRKAQRDALVSYLIAEEASDDIEDADDLYERYLIDVSMNPEMLTSRIKQAACSVQLFIHRCLFGLEQWTVSGNTVDLGDYFNDDDRAEWEWMRTYRVWEAARKVFLYPENWIEPELRDDKTPFFRSLESELAQGEIDDERSEQVLLDYLDRLHEVSSLKILASLVQKESDADGTIDYLHVFARTQSDPPTYWYRRREDSATWTAWERIEAGVQGDHLIPVVYNRRLMLFWAEFTETQSESETASVTSWWEIRLAMSTYRDGRWSTKKLSTDPLSLQSSQLTDHGLNHSALYRYGFLSSQTDDLLTITCYGATQSSAIGDYTFFYLIGTFELNPCTMEIDPSYASITDSERSVLDHNYWWSPGFWTFDYDENLQRIDHLTINLGSYDEETGEPEGDYAPVSVLESLYDATVIVPSQWENFVSQSPFFINVDKRVYFVIPADTEDTVEATLEFEQGQPVSATLPAVSSVNSMREGTTSSLPATSSLTTADAQRVSRYLDANEYASSTDAVNAIVSADASLVALDDASGLTTPAGGYAFYNFYHPHICRFIREVRRSGVFGLLNPDPESTAGDLFRQQLETDPTEFAFETEFLPTDRVATPYPVEDIDFTSDGAYSQYNWEIFFHLPFYVGSRLADAGRFEDALNWMHCVFDPRTRAELPPPPDGETYVSDAKWWKFRPFLTSASAAVTDYVAFSGADGTAEDQEEFERQVAAWREDPFNPHLIARLRPGTYQKAFVMRYLDTLIGWGDQLFTKDTIESINEATQLYVFAKKVLGDRPEELEPATELTAQSYADLEATLDDFGNALVAIENSSFSATGLGSSSSGSSSTSGLGYTAYFCVPPNAKLLSYWDTVEDRLFKIRNGMNIAGVVRSLPLFEPPIDPAMLVRAAAAGVDIGAAVDGLSVARPHHRFSVVFARAQAVAGSLKALGGALLSALEKRDSEALAMLRQNQEEALQKAVRAVREQQVEEAQESLRATRKQKRMVEARRDYYERLIDTNLIEEEKTAGDLTKASVILDTIGATIQGISAVLSAFPNVAGPIPPTAEIGGTTFSNVLGSVASTVSMSSGALKTEAGRLTTTASYARRKQEWKFQKKQAEKELDMIEKQIEAAQIRMQIAKKELHNHELQMSHSTEVREWMERKYTNAELYDWMVSQLSTLHFQTYQLALSTAKKAEACYNYELGRSDSFVQPVYWDGLRKGLLAGERLAADLDRMDIAYLEKDAREYELIKHISMAMLDPMALALLRSSGECWFEVPEVWFDADCAGHYFRRIQSVALSIACVTGMNSTVNAQLTLHGHATRTEAVAGTDLEWEAGDYTSIVTSVAVNDTGLFSADPRDPRYLPFERRGAISRWHLRLTAQVWKQLDWESIADVTLHMRYTARDGGASFRTAVEGTGGATLLAALAADVGLGRTSSAFDVVTTTGTPVLFSAKRDAPDAFYEAQYGATAGTFELDLDSGMVPDIDTYAYTRVVAIPVYSSTTVPTVSQIESVSTSSITIGSVTGHAAAVSVTLPMTLTLVLTNATSLTDLLVILLPAE